MHSCEQYRCLWIIWLQTDFQSVIYSTAHEKLQPSDANIRCELNVSQGEKVLWSWTCIQVKDNFAMLSVVFNSLFVPSLQMEVDADDKRHRTRSKGIGMDTHPLALQFRVTFTPPAQMHTHAHIYCTHTTAQIPDCHSWVTFSHCSLSSSDSLWYISQTESQSAYFKRFVQNEIYISVTSNPTKLYMVQIIELFEILKKQ